MNAPVLPPQKLIVPREVCLLLGFNLFAVLWVHIFHSLTHRRPTNDEIHRDLKS